MSHKVDRRFFLKTAAIAAGGSIVSPFGNSLAFAAKNGTAPLRYLQIMTDYSVVAPDFWPNATPDQMIGPNARTMSLSSLTIDKVPAITRSFYDSGLFPKMSFVRGARACTYTEHNASIATTGSGKEDGAPVVFPFSIDQILARSPKMYEAVPQVTSVSLAPAANNTDPGMASYSYSHFDGSRPTVLWNSNDLATLLFGDRSPAGVSKATARLKAIEYLQTSYLDQAKKSGLRSEDRKRVELVSDLFSDVKRRTTSVNATCNEPTRTPEGSTDEAFKNHARLIAAAFACDQTRVVAIGLRSRNTTGDLHEAHHHSDGVPALRKLLTDTKVERYAQMAFLLKTLAETPDVDGRSVLDNTIVLINSEYGGYGRIYAHSLQDFPLIIAGGGSRFKMGEYIDYRLDQKSTVQAGRLYNNVLVAIFNAFGLSSADYQRRNLTGFGDYRGVPANLASYATNAERIKPIDYLYTGVAMK